MFVPTREHLPVKQCLADAGFDAAVAECSPNTPLARASDMRVLIRWRGRNVTIPLSQLTPLNADESTAEAIADWHYWPAQDRCF